MNRRAVADIVIEAPSEQVWELISSPGHLAECHPFCASNPVESWPGDGSVDRIDYYGGRRLVRRFVGWDEGRGYDIELSDANGPVARAEWRMSSESPGRSRLAVAITPRMLDDRSAPVRWLAGFVVGPMLRRYLRSVLAGVEHRVTTGKPVVRNQFGSHVWFSPAE